MEMKEVYLRKPIKKECIGGFFDLPRGTICYETSNLIIYDEKVICYASSETGKSFCDNDPYTIEHLDILDELIPLDPPEEMQEGLGEFHPMGWWQWYEEVLERPNDELRELLNKIKNQGEVV